MKIKVIAVPEEKNNSCKGCDFNNGSDMYDWTCPHKDQIVDGVKMSCGDKGSYIFKRVEEKDMNEMPTLDSGMIVELKNGSKYLHINNEWGLSLCGSSYFKDVAEHDIISIYEASGFKGFTSLGGGLKLIWSRKSDNDIKIEELQESLTNLEDNHSKAVAEIKEKIKGFKS
jgi:hypothetical protein